MSFMPQTAWPSLLKHVRLGSGHPDNSEHLQPAASGVGEFPGSLMTPE